MANAGTAKVRITADASNFTRNMNRVQGRLGKLGSGVRAVAGHWRLFSVAIAGAAAGVGLMIRQQAQLGDELGKLSKRTGVAVETLDAYRLGLELSDVKMKEFGTAIKTLTKNIGDTAQGTGEAIIWFEKLGIKATDASGNLRSTHEVMLDFVEAMESLPRQEVATLMLDVFGARAGFAMQTFFANGRKGLQDFLKEGQKLGTWTTEQTAQMEEFNDNMTRLKRLLSNFARGLAAEVVPKLDEFVKGLVAGEDSAKSFEEVGRSLGRALIWMGKVVKVLYETLQLLWQTWEKGEAVLEFFAIKWQQFISLILKGQILLSKIPKIGETIFGNTAELQAHLDEFERIITVRTEALGIKIQKILARQSAIGAIIPTFKVPPITLLRGKQQVFKIPTRLDLSGAGADAKKQMDQLLAQFKKEQILLLGGPQAVAALGITQRLKDYKQLLDAGRITKNEYIQIQDALVASLNNTTAAAKSSFESMNQFAIQSARAMETAFADFFFNVMDGNFKNLNSLVQDFERTIMKLIANLIAQDIAGAIFGKGFGTTGQVGGLLGGLGGLLNFPGLLNLGTKTPAPTGIGKMAQIIPFAHGGLVTQPTIGLLAEREPEIVTPVSKILRGLSEQPPTIINNWNINTNDAGSFREFLFQNKDAVMDVIGYANANNHGSRRFA